MGIRAFANSFRSGWGAASAAVTAGPLALLATDLTPPWPTEGGGAAATLGTVAGLIGLIFAYLDRRQGKARADRAGNMLKLAVGFILIFVILWSTLIVTAPQMVQGELIERRYLVGFTMRNLGESISAIDAIKKYGLESAYPPLSLLGGRLATIIAWMASLGLLTYGFGLLQTKR